MFATLRYMLNIILCCRVAAALTPHVRMNSLYRSTRRCVNRSR